MDEHVKKPFDFDEQNRKLLASSIQQNYEMKKEIKYLKHQVWMIKDCIKELHEMLNYGNR